MNSEPVKVNGENLIYMRESMTLLNHIGETLARVGAEQFFRSPNQDVKRVRESWACLFFMLELQSRTSDGIFFFQPKNDPPDFILMKLGDQLEDMALEAYELVEIPPRSKSFEEAMGIIQKKIIKGYSESYNLLVYINNEKSTEWVHLINNQLQTYSPFKSVWTIHLLELKGDYWPVVNRLRPSPVIHIETKLEHIKFPRGVPKFMKEKIDSNGARVLSFKPDLMKKFLIKLRKIRIGRS